MRADLRLRRASAWGRLMTAPPSPCNGICQIAPKSGWCLGCARTIDEIAAWPMMTAVEKQAVLDRLRLRR